MENGIHTLHEFMLHTKSQLYPLAAIFLMSLVGFWMYLTGGEKTGPHPVKADSTHDHDRGKERSIK